MPGSIRLPSSAKGPPHAGPLPSRLVSDLRTDHAGETGAVMIYRGIIATTRDAEVRSFAQGHLTTEAAHLAAIEQLLAPRHRSRLLPLWRGAGWLTGALPAWIGPRAVYATVEAVETFVDHHYTEQIDAIDRLDPARAQVSLQALRAQLHSFRTDEIDHRDDAAARFDRHAAPPSLPSGLLRLWIWAVGAGSRGVVKICRWISTMTIEELSMTPSNTIRSDEVARFNRLAATWWNRTGPMRPLHVVNELRLGYALKQIAQRFGRPVGALQGLRIADVGCDAGLLLASTINRTLRSYLAAIVGAEMVFRVLPRGTHHWTQFVRSEELKQAAAACGLAAGERRGTAYLPAAHRAWWTRGLAVNYIASFDKPDNASP